MSVEEPSERVRSRGGRLARYSRCVAARGRGLGLRQKSVKVLIDPRKSWSESASARSLHISGKSATRAAKRSLSYFAAASSGSSAYTQSQLSEARIPAPARYRPGRSVHATGSLFLM
jgi:hypothetical protein